MFNKRSTIDNNGEFFKKTFLNCNINYKAFNNSEEFFSYSFPHRSTFN